VTEGRERPVGSRRAIRALVVVGVIAGIWLLLTLINRGPDDDQTDVIASTTTAPITESTTSATANSTTTPSSLASSTTSVTGSNTTVVAPIGNTDIYVVDAAGGGGVFLAPGSQPTWSSDGIRIAVTTPNQ
jgi:cytoskeletal protein RodZ